jgi:hypothetical protein
MKQEFIVASTAYTDKDGNLVRKRIWEKNTAENLLKKKKTLLDGKKETPTVGLEPTTTRLRALRSTD